MSKFSFTNGYSVEEKLVVKDVEAVENGDKVDCSTIVLDGVV